MRERQAIWNFPSTIFVFTDTHKKCTKTRSKFALSLFSLCFSGLKEESINNLKKTYIQRFKVLCMNSAHFPAETLGRFEVYIWTTTSISKSIQQSGRYVNLRTPSCHGKRRVAGTRSYASYISRSISAENLPKWTSKLSSRVGGHDRSLAELFSFSSKWMSLQARWAVHVQWQKALPAISDGETKWQGECVVHWKPEEDSSSQSARQDVEEESMERRWKWPSFNALIVLSWRALGYRTKAKVLLVVETEPRSLHTFCNDRERGGRGMDVFTCMTWGWLWGNDRWRSYTKKSQHQ